MLTARREHVRPMIAAARKWARTLAPAAVGSAVVLGGCAASAAPPVPATLTFEETFDTLSFELWSTVPKVNDPAGNGSSLPGNKERQWYINHAYAPTKAVRPWRVENGELVITADRAPPRIKPLLGYPPDQIARAERDWPGAGKQLPALGGYAYTSGRLSTHKAFSQTYGYFEAEAKLPAGKGLWPAFWLLPTDMSWPPEIDVFEVLGHEPDKIYQTLHWREPAKPDGEHKRAHVEVRADTREWRRYGVLWTPETITFYVDGKPTRRLPTPADMHRPMYLILNLAVGGSWPGDPDATTKFPAEMRVRSVRAWRLG
jgi:beta-glucanase (GH16 family)